MVVSTSVSDSASVFRKNWWREAFESCNVLKQLRWSQLISPGIYSGNTVLLRDSAVRPEPGKEAVLQVNGCLSHLLISGEGIVVIDRDLQVFLLRQVAAQFVHSAKHWVESVGNVVVSVFNYFLAQGYFYVRITQAIVVLRLEL